MASRVKQKCAFISAATFDSPCILVGMCDIANPSYHSTIIAMLICSCLYAKRVLLTSRKKEKSWMEVRLNIGISFFLVPPASSCDMHAKLQ